MPNPYDQFSANISPDLLSASPAAGATSPPVVANPDAASATPPAASSSDASAPPRPPGAPPIRVYITKPSPGDQDSNPYSQFQGDISPDLLADRNGSDRTISGWEAAGRGALAGATLNFGDELHGLVNSFSGGPDAVQRYNDTVAADRAADKAAVEQHPYLYGAGAVGGGLALAPLAPEMLGGRAATAGARFARGAAQGALYSGAAGVGAGETPEDRVVGGVTGAALGGLAGGVLDTAVGPRIPKTETPSAADVAAAAQRLNIAKDLPVGLASNSGALQKATQGLAQVPFAGSWLISNPIARAAESLGQRAEEAGNRMASAVGAGGDRATIGAAARDSLQRAVDAADGKADVAFSNLRGAIDPNKTVPVPGNVITPLDKIVQSRIAAGENGVPITGLEATTDLLTRLEGASFNGLQRARTQLSKAINWDQRNGGFYVADLKHAYDALSDAMENAVRSTARGDGDEAVKLYKDANKTYADTLTHNKDLRRFLANGSDERIVDRILSFGSDKSGQGDIHKLAQLMNSMGKEEWGGISGYAIHQMGTDASGNFSNAAFLRRYKSLSDKAKEMLFGRQGTNTREYIDDIATVADRLKSSGKYANHSNTAGTLALLGLLGLGEGPDLIDKIEDHPYATGLSLVAALALSRPATARWMANYSRLGAVFLKAPTAASRAALMVGARELSASFGHTLGVKIDPNALVPQQ